MGFRYHDVTVLRGVLIPEGGRRAGVAGTSHELSSGGSPRRGPRQAGAPQLVEMNLSASEVVTGGDPGGVERVASESPALETSEKRSGRLRADE